MKRNKYQEAMDDVARKWRDEGPEAALQWLDDNGTPETRRLVADVRLEQDAGGSEVDYCPEHGQQVVTRFSTTPGADPYSVSHLACGHRVACFGPGEANVILGTAAAVAARAGEDVLGPCGCTDYHLADCPTRTGSRGVDAATIYAMSPDDFDRYMDREEW